MKPCMIVFVTTGYQTAAKKKVKGFSIIVIKVFILFFIEYLFMQDSLEREEDKGLIIERILILARNILQVPADPDVEKRTDNDASIHDQVRDRAYLIHILYLQIKPVSPEILYFLHHC